MRLGEIGAGPLLAAEGSLGGKLKRRAIGIVAELGGFVVLTPLLPVALIAAAIVDLALWIRRRKPWVGVRLVLLLWWFLATELFALATLAVIWLRAGGPLGKGSMIRRRGVYWLRPRWARSHLGGAKRLFGLRIEVEGLEVAEPGPILILIRHASIIDNMLPDATIAFHKGFGIRYVVKRELEVLPAIDIGGRWIPTNFVNRASGATEAEVRRLIELTRDLGPAEGMLIYPEGTRATAQKIARAKEIIRERQPELAPLADQLTHLLPPRLGGPLALLEHAPGVDVVLCAHVGFDGYEHASDLWSGRLVGQTIKVRFWRIPASAIPDDERGRTEWLYEQWLKLDAWVEEHRGEVVGAKAAQRIGSAA